MKLVDRKELITVNRCFQTGEKCTEVTEKTELLFTSIANLSLGVRGLITKFGHNDVRRIITFFKCTLTKG